MQNARIRKQYPCRLTSKEDYFISKNKFIILNQTHNIDRFTFTLIFTIVGIISLWDCIALVSVTLYSPSVQPRDWTVQPDNTGEKARPPSVEVRLPPERVQLSPLTLSHCNNIITHGQFCSGKIKSSCFLLNVIILSKYNFSFLNANCYSWKSLGEFGKFSQ